MERNRKLEQSRSLVPLIRWARKTAVLAFIHRAARLSIDRQYRLEPTRIRAHVANRFRCAQHRKCYPMQHRARPAPHDISRFTMSAWPCIPSSLAELGRTAVRASETVAVESILMCRAAQNPEKGSATVGAGKPGFSSRGGSCGSGTSRALASSCLPVPGDREALFVLTRPPRKR